MSKFAAIEARATQYPASTNDVVWLVTRVREMRDALQIVLDAGIADVWERPATEAARMALQALEEPNLPVD